MANNLKLESTYDRATTSRKLDGWPIVFHCHYYSTLFAQLADDAHEFDGKKIMVSAMAESISPILKRYYNECGAQTIDEKKKIAEKYFSAVGLGTFHVTELSEQGGMVEMPSSHLDSAWLLRWNTWDQAINFMGQGFIIATFATIFDTSIDEYIAIEQESIVKGAKKSIFKVQRRKK